MACCSMGQMRFHSNSTDIKKSPLSCTESRIVPAGDGCCVALRLH